MAQEMYAVDRVPTTREKPPPRQCARSDKYESVMEPRQELDALEEDDEFEEFAMEGEITHLCFGVVMYPLPSFLAR